MPSFLIARHLLALVSVTFFCAPVAADLIVDYRETVRGPTVIRQAVVNNGVLAGAGSAPGERLVIEGPWKVSGSGVFNNTLVLGTFAPGNSPGVVNGMNQGFGGTVEFELGGLMPGFGNDNHDQIIDSATIFLVDSPTLSIRPWNAFVPAVGNQFTVMTWGTGLSGSFGTVAIDAFYANHGLAFTVEVNNPGGAGSLVLSAVAIPEAAPLLPLALIAGCGWITSRIGKKFRRRI